MKLSSLVPAIALSFGLSGVGFSASVDELKAQIINISTENMERFDNFAEVRELLQPLVEELRAKQDLSEDEKLELKLGGWKQLWTDDADDSNSNTPISKALRNQTYQYVSADGFFYNISTVAFPFGIKETGFLRAEYTKAPEGGADFFFTGFELTRGATTDESDLEAISLALENDEVRSTPLNFLRFPRGPVGAKGFIDTVYIDDQIRIDEGYNKADGDVDLFVLIRQ